MLRIKPYEAIPFRWWTFCILEVGNGEEYYFAALRLPSYQWGHDLYQNIYRWLQLTITWHGRDGFSACWLPCLYRGE